MLKKILISCCLLLTQFLPLTMTQAQAQTYPGYTDWNSAVRAYLGCDQSGVICNSNFEVGKPIFGKDYDCLGSSVLSSMAISSSMCAQPVGTWIYGNDIFQIYNQYIGNFSQYLQNAQTNTYPFIIIDYPITSSDSIPSFLIEYWENANGGYVTPHSIQSVPILGVCDNYIESLGCADSTLDRTNMDDGPCEICSKIGNPFDVRNGAKYEHGVDLEFPLTVSRNYSSRKRVAGMFGLNWRSNYDKTLKIVKNNGIITSLLFINPNGDYIIFQSNDGTTFTTLYSDQGQNQISINNNQIKLTRPDSGVEIYDMTSSKIISENYKGQTLTYQYSNFGLLNRVTDQFGRYLQFNYSGYADVVDQIYASNGDTVTYTYDGGNIATVSFNNIPQITYAYDNQLLTAKLDGNGVQYASFIYDSQGRGIENKWITTDGHDIKKYTLSYDGNNTTVTQDSGLSRTYNMTSINSANKISGMTWNGKSESANFDASGNVQNKTDLDGFFESYNYDSANRVNSYTRDGKTKNITWLGNRNLIDSVVETSPNGTRTTGYSYDSNNNLTSVFVSGGGSQKSVSKVVDTYGRVTHEEDEQRAQKNYIYYPIDNTPQSGLLKSIIANTGATIIINSYDVRGNPTSVTTNGITKTMTYDYKSRLLSETVGSATNNYAYDINGNMITSQMATGYQLNMTYDSASRLLGISDNMGGTASFGIDDATGEVLNTSIGQNNALVRARNKIIDSLGRTTQTWNATLRTKETTNYGSLATLPDSTTDANGIQSTYTWNSQGNNINFSGGNDSGNKSYDVDGNLTRVAMNGQVTTMSYDDLGRISSINSPDSGSKNYTYTSNTDSYTDGKGTVHSVMRGYGQVIQVEHNTTNQALGDSKAEAYDYDNYGQVIDILSNDSMLTYTRNSLGQLISKSQDISTHLLVQYAYDSAGQKISDTYPSGLVVNYGYTNGFLTSITSGGTTIVSNVQYNSLLKEPVSWSLGGQQVSMNKDTDGILTSFVDTGVMNQSIGTDNEGHITSVADSMSSNNFNVSLNPNYSIQAGTINGKSLSYDFTLNGNLNSQMDGITNYEFDMKNGSNQIDTLYYGRTANQFTYQYDGNGNLTVDQKGTYKYDGNNNLEMYYPAGANSNYTRYDYNALNQRVDKQTQGGQLRSFAYNENNQLIGEYDSNGNAIVEYIYFGLRPVAVKNGSTISIVHTDYLSTPRIIMNGGSVVWQWRNDNPYGNNLAQGSIEFNLRFAGQYYDSESGLHYNINRMYNPELGRYMQSDPMGLAAGLNTYNYANRNPLDGIDPLGLDGISAAAGYAITQATHNPITSGYGYFVLGVHGYKAANGQDTFILEEGSEVVNQLSPATINYLQKFKNEVPDIENGVEVLHMGYFVDGHNLAIILKMVMGDKLKNYKGIKLLSCNGANLRNPMSGEYLAQEFSNEIKMKTIAYDKTINVSTGSRIGDSALNPQKYYLSGYEVKDGDDISEISSLNAIGITKQFLPK